jgi:hypothetical protein
VVKAVETLEEGRKAFLEWVLGFEIIQAMV